MHWRRTQCYVSGSLLQHKAGANLRNVLILAPVLMPRGAFPLLSEGPASRQLSVATFQLYDFSLCCRTDLRKAGDSNGWCAVAGVVHACDESGLAQLLLHILCQKALFVPTKGLSWSAR